MGTVIPEDIIVFLQGGANAGGDGLLPGIEMARAAYFPFHDGLDQTLFAESYSNHHPVQVFQNLSGICQWPLHEFSSTWCRPESLAEYTQVLPEFNSFFCSVSMIPKAV